MPPPSKTEVAPAVPAVDVPTSEPMPKEVCGIEPPMPPHVVTLPFVDPVGPIGDTPEVLGLTPGDASSVAPRGIPAGATGEPGPMPSGEVVPSGEGPGERLIPPTCAMAELQLKRIAAVVVIIKRVIVGSTLFCIGRRPAPPPTSTKNPIVRVESSVAAMGKLANASAIGGWRRSSRSPEGRSEGARFTEANRQPDLGHRARCFCQ